MPSLEETLLVFTDLDGTLLDFHTLTGSLRPVAGKING